MSLQDSYLSRSPRSSRGIVELWEMELMIWGYHFSESLTTSHCHTQDFADALLISLRTTDVWILGEANFLGTLYVFSKYFQLSAILIWLKFTLETLLSKKTYFLLWILMKSSWQINLIVYFIRVCDSESYLGLGSFRQSWVEKLRKRFLKFFDNFDKIFKLIEKCAVIERPLLYILYQTHQWLTFAPSPTADFPFPLRVCARACACVRMCACACACVPFPHQLSLTR